ncbi:MAG: glycosyltransferase [Sulfitobacter sp.]|nr:glycosyltransferase [Sulfitobacter sp.]
MRVMIVVTHLLGTGHLARALVLARALQEAGEEVNVVSGGMPAPQLHLDGIPFVQLPPVRSDGVDFTRLMTELNEIASDEFLERRSAFLVETLEDFAPDVLITELFPFGRRILRAEFLALLTAARNSPAPPIICASVRDILAPPTKPKKAVFAKEILTEFYDAVLVHSDPDLMPLDLSWPVTEPVAKKLRYTGFVAPAAAPVGTDDLGEGEILVSAGGGAVGTPLFECAVAAAQQRPGLNWRLLIGGHQGEDQAAALQKQAGPNLIAEPARPEFRAMLHRAAASVSLCGYNTALDILQAGTPAIFIPFDAGSEVEQGIRAEALAKQPAITQIRAQDLTAEALLAAIDRVRADPPRAKMTRGLDGAHLTVEILRELKAARS